MMTREEAAEFTNRWLPKWSGNRPEELITFYADDAFFLDPARPQGIEGKEELLAYFQKALGHNPEWVWSQVEPIAIEGGLLNKLKGGIPVGEKIVECTALCLLQFNDEGKIKRNEIYFDRTALNREIADYRQSLAH